MRPVGAPCRPWRDWIMPVAGAASNFVSFGVLFSFGLFLTPLAETFRTSTGPVAPLFSGSVGAYYLAGALGGRFADRHGARPVIVFAALTLPLGLVLTSWSSSLWQVYVFYIPLVGLAVGSCYAPMIGAVGRRFSERRSLAIAIVLTGVGAGTLVMPLVVRVLLDQMSWRGTFRLLAAVSFVLLVATAVSVPAQKEPKAVSQLGPRTMAGSAPFRRLYLSVVLIAPGFYAPLAFLNDYAVSVGSSASTAAFLVAAIGLSSVASRIWFGGLAERVGALRQYEFSHLVFVVGLAVWLLARDSTLVLFVAAGLHGLAWAAWVTAAPLVLAQWFGVDDLGQLVGGFYTGLGLGAFLGPAISGFVIDTAGYRPAIALVVVTSLLSVATLRTVRHLDPVA